MTGASVILDQYDLFIHSLNNYLLWFRPSARHQWLMMIQTSKGASHLVGLTDIYHKVSQYM